LGGDVHHATPFPSGSCATSQPVPGGKACRISGFPLLLLLIQPNHRSRTSDNHHLWRMGIITSASTVVCDPYRSAARFGRHCFPTVERFGYVSAALVRAWFSSYHGSRSGDFICVGKADSEDSNRYLGSSGRPTTPLLAGCGVQDVSGDSVLHTSSY